jgi:PIN domain nuclease of toxin-antitoxin system
MKKRKGKFVLDSYAVLTYLKEEPGWQEVRDILWQAYNTNNVFMSYVNLGEVYYIVYRENGPAVADQAISLVKLWPVKFLGANEDSCIIAGRMKAENKISYADAFVIAAALSKKATILTGDREFKSVEDIVNIHWLPKNR